MRFSLVDSLSRPSHFLTFSQNPLLFHPSIHPLHPLTPEGLHELFQVNGLTFERNAGQRGRMERGGRRKKRKEENKSRMLLPISDFFFLLAYTSRAVIPACLRRPEPCRRSETVLSDLTETTGLSTESRESAVSAQRKQRSGWMDGVRRQVLSPSPHILFSLFSVFFFFLTAFP